MKSLKFYIFACSFFKKKTWLIWFCLSFLPSFAAVLWCLDFLIVLSISHCRQSWTNSLFYLNTSKYFLSFSGTLLFSSVLHFLCGNIQNHHFFLKKLIGQWIPDCDGQGIIRDIKKKYFHFQNATKNGNKVGTIYKVWTLLYISAF